MPSLCLKFINCKNKPNLLTYKYIKRIVYRESIDEKKNYGCHCTTLKLKHEAYNYSKQISTKTDLSELSKLPYFDKSVKLFTSVSLDVTIKIGDSLT